MTTVPAAVAEPGTGVVALYVADLGHVAVDPCLPLDDEERRRAARFVRPEDRHRYETAHRFLRRALADFSGLSPGSLRFDRAPCPTCGGAHGKPRLCGDTGIGFSLSWSSGTVAVAASIGRSVGVDVERGGGHCVPGWERTFCTDEELEELACAPSGVRQALAVAVWTRKEAVLKATGEGLGRDPRTVHVGAHGDRLVENVGVRSVSSAPVGSGVAVACVGGLAAVTVRSLGMGWFAAGSTHLKAT